MASALKYAGKGVIYELQKIINKGTDSSEENFIWWSSLNLENFHQNYLTMLETYGVSSYTKTLRMNSEAAVNQFEDNSIDILHIDGNHSAEVSLKNVKMYCPKLKKMATYGLMMPIGRKQQTQFNI